MLLEEMIAVTSYNHTKYQMKFFVEEGGTKVLTGLKIVRRTIANIHVLLNTFL